MTQFKGRVIDWSGQLGLIKKYHLKKKIVKIKFDQGFNWIDFVAD